MTEKVIPRVQKAEIGIFPRRGNLSFLDKVKKCRFYKSLNIESLLLGIERSQLRWFGHVTRISQERTAKNCCVEYPLVEGREAVPESRWPD